MSEWNPIETAPKDDIILSSRYECIEIVHWQASPGDGIWKISAGGFAPDPSYWMPLPEPPRS